MTDAGKLESFTPEGWAGARGYSHAIRHGDRLFIAGVLPVDPATQEVKGEGFAEQWATTLENLTDLVKQAGGSPSDVAVLRIYVTSIDSYREAGRDLGAGWKSTFGSHFPAITLVEVAALIDPAALLEIEGEALL